MRDNRKETVEQNLVTFTNKYYETVSCLIHERSVRVNGRSTRCKWDNRWNVKV